MIKKIFLIVVLFCSTLYANNSIEAKILDKIFFAAFKKNDIKVWVSSKRLEDVVLECKTLRLIKECKRADVLLLDKRVVVPNECKNVLLFVFEYDLLKVYAKSFGAFYWQKGRSNLIFIEPRLKKENISLPKSFSHYFEERVW